MRGPKGQGPIEGIGIIVEIRRAAIAKAYAGTFLVGALK